MAANWLDRVTVNELPVGNRRATLHFRRRRDGIVEPTRSACRSVKSRNAR